MRLACPAVVVALAVGVPRVASADDVRTLYETKCAMCHGKDGAGSAMGQRLGAADLRKTKLSAPELEKIISKGRAKMPAYEGKLSDEQISGLVKLIQSGLK